MKHFRNILHSKWCNKTPLFNKLDELCLSIQIANAQHIFYQKFRNVIYSRKSIPITLCILVYGIVFCYILNSMKKFVQFGTHNANENSPSAIFISKHKSTRIRFATMYIICRIYIHPITWKFIIAWYKWKRNFKNYLS